MNVQCYMICHYGADYISYAIQSVYSLVDKIHIFYTPTPSHGHGTDLPPVESKEQIQRAAFSFNPDKKIHWYVINNVTQEGPQRDYAVSVCEQAGNADLILVLDYDEIWHESILRRALYHAWDSNSARNWLINFTHLWRSFNWCCEDEGWPIRIIDTRHKSDTGFIPKEFGEIYHFGYAITDKVMHYKWQIHGHKNEMRPNWLSEKWDNWTPNVKDVHPTNERDFWTPKPFDKTTLPEIMRDHYFYDMDIIR